MIVRIKWGKHVRDYTNMDDVSLRIHTLVMNRISFTVDYL